MAFLAVYGHVNVDYILQVNSLPARDTTVPVVGELVRLGGTGGNVARAAASLGVPTALAACVGDDFPPEYRALLSTSGIDLTDLKKVAGPTPKIWILSTPDGGQSAIIDQGVMGDAYARPRLDLSMLDSNWTHFTTGSPKDWLPVARDAASARKHVAFDPAQELAYRYDPRTFEDFLNQTSLFFANEAELGRALRLLEYGDPVQLLDHAEALVVTRGAKGLRFVSEKERFELPACPVRGRDRVDAVGAGDVLRGGIYAGLHRRQGWPEALRTGAAAASLFLESGGQRFPAWNHVEERLSEWSP